MANANSAAGRSPGSNAKDTLGRFEYVPRQTLGIEDRFPRLASGDFNTGMRLIAPSGRIFVGADAIYHIAQELPFWRRLAWLYRVPGIHQLAQWVYALVVPTKYPTLTAR